jgi:hypothetical protein
MQNRRAGFVISTLLTVVFGLAFATPALGIPDIYTPQWATGESGGSHGWAMGRAADMAAARGATWVDKGTAVGYSGYPDTTLRDNIDHNANWWGTYDSYYNSSWGHYFGNPQGKVQANYNAAVAALRRGDRGAASRYIGIMSHYFIDINGPMHTQESATENNSFHSALEEDAGGYNFSSYISDDGYQYRGSPSAFTVECANHSHPYYSSLISAYGSGHNFNSTVKNIEGTNLNRGVNGLADLIQSAQADADNVSAVIVSVSPSSWTTGTPVTFVGSGVDPSHAITQYSWRSDRDGALSTAPSFPTSTLSLGIHKIFLNVACSAGRWSGEVFVPYVVGADGTIPLPVYRFFNFTSGMHLYTASEVEKQDIVNRLSSSWRFEGAGYALDSSATANSAPLYRFRNYRNGSYFYTTSPVERDYVGTALRDTFHYETEAYKVSTTPEPGTLPVYRFLNFKNGTHFFTDSEVEREYVGTRLGATYRYELVAFYYAPPWPIP